MVINLNTGLKHLQTPPNVLAQLHVRTNGIIALLTVLNTIALLIKLSTLRSHLYASIIFLYLKYLLLLKIQLYQMIPLLNLHQLILMDGNIIIFLQVLLRGFKI